MKKLFISILLFNTVASAFTFDIWESKISLKEAIQIAKSNNIPLAKDGAIGVGKEFNKKVLYLNKYPDNRVFRYSTKLLNENATIALYFTKKSKKLYTIKIRWMKRNKEFINTVYALLDDKYGKRKTIIPINIGDFILNNTRQWEPNEETIIQTKSGWGLTTVDYYDVKETHQEEKERDEISTEKKTKLLNKDANKF